MVTLRERQKIETANSIRRVAVDMVFENGLDNVTAEMISEKVGISPRTFFNYFSYKEAALLPPTLEFSKEDVQTFAAGSGQLQDDLADLIVPMMEFYAENRQMLKKLLEISLSSPKLSMIKVNVFHDFEQMLGGLIARRLQLNARSGNAGLMAALITTTLRVAMENWVKDSSGSPDEYIREALNEMQTAFQD